MRPLRVYTDTSVFGGCYDEEFAEHSERFFALVESGRVVVLLSDVVLKELVPAPARVRAVLARLPFRGVVRWELTREMRELRDAYLAAGVVGQGSHDDAFHVAAATVARADAIVSWNFKHIVRLDRIKAYNAINLIHGYGVLTILSPREVLLDEED